MGAVVTRGLWVNSKLGINPVWLKGFTSLNAGEKESCIAENSGVLEMENWNRSKTIKVEPGLNMLHELI